jgi:putative ABC transport system permease protein
VTAELFISMLDQMDHSTLLTLLSAIQVFEGGAYDIAYEDAKSACDKMTTEECAAAYRSYAQPLAVSESAAASLWDTYLKTGSSSSTYKTNLRLLGVADKDTPTVIYLYPKSFEAKESISNEISEYNAAHPNSEISYTDYIGIMLKSVSTILKVITYVLVAFVGISLVVSSIMIGIITYISVLERIKEIGILRAIGASKRDVSHVFLAETLIVGFTAGMIGILITVILCVPINIIIRALSGFSNIAARLPIVGAVALVLISMLLTLVAGLIPAKIAAKKEPVEALRSE